MVGKITKALVERVKVPRGKRDLILWDSELNGFCCRIPQAGRPTYWAWKRSPGGRRVRVTIGEHGAWTAEQARAQAVRDLADIVDARNPADRGPAVPGFGRTPWGDVEARAASEADAEIESQLPTVDKLCTEYLARWATAPNKKAKSIEEDHRNIETHIRRAMVPTGDDEFVRLGEMKVRNVTAEHVEAFHQRLGNGELADDGTWKNAPKPVVANRCRSLLSKMLGKAEEWGMRERGTNPVRGVKRYTERKREAVLSDLDKRRLAKAMTELVNERTVTTAVSRAIQLTLLVGFRKGEILSARFDQVDYHRAVIRLPDSKVGQRNVRLGPAALTILRDADDGSSPWIVPGEDRSKHRARIQEEWDSVRRRARLPHEAGKPFPFHGLRHTLGSDMAAAGYSQKYIAEQLGITVEVASRYTHAYDKTAREALAAAEAGTAAAFGIVAKPTKKKPARLRAVKA